MRSMLQHYSPMVTLEISKHFMIYTNQRLINHTFVPIDDDLSVFITMVQSIDCSYVNDINGYLTVLSDLIFHQSICYNYHSRAISNIIACRASHPKVDISDQYQEQVDTSCSQPLLYNVSIKHCTCCKF